MLACGFTRWGERVDLGSRPAARWHSGRMKTTLACPCGTVIRGTDEDDLVERTQAHLASEHPGRDYDRDSILFMAT